MPQLHALVRIAARGFLLATGLLFAAAAAALDPHKSFHDFVSNSWSIEQGLPQISALAITQDPRGYLWVGTQAGLARFDGHRFTAFTPEDSPGLPGAYINALLTDAEGRVWVGSYKGLAYWDGQNFSPVPLDDSAGGTEANVQALAVLPTGGLLVAAGSELHAVENARARLHVRLPRPARSLLAETGVVWVGSVGGVYRLQEQAEPELLALPESARHANCRSLLRARGQLWAGCSEGLFVLGPNGFERSSALPELAQAPIEAMLLDRDGNHWIAELAHLTRVRADGSRERIVRDGSGLSIRALFEDREANLWLGSQWSGVTRLRNGWTRRYGARHGLDTPLLWSLAAADNGALWIGSDDGLLRFANERFERVLAGSALPHPSVYTLHAEGDTAWLGTRQGLALFEQGVVSVPERYEALASLQINGIVRDAAGRLWFATSSGAFVEDAGRLRRFGEAEGLRDPRVRFLLPQADGSLLLGSQSGLYEIREDRPRPSGAAQGLPPGLDITALHRLDNGDLVAGTLAESSYLFSGGRWRPLGVEQGLPRNAPFFFAHDETYLWIGGIRGIGRVPLSDLADYASGDRLRLRGEMLLNERGDRRGGQKGYCCNGAGNAKGLQRGRALWAPSRDGLVVLDTQDVRPPELAPPALIERVRIGSRWQPAHAAEALALPADSRDLGFEFTAISFHEPRSLGFRYRLQGYQPDWREPDEVSQRVAAYTNLPAGSYRFEVQGSTAEGQWGESALLDFSIAPHFSETRAFDLLLAAAVAVVGYAGFRLQRHRYRQRAAQLEALVQQRTSDLAEANQRLHEASLTDPLTGLRNRRYLGAQIPKDLAFYMRELEVVHPQPRVILFALADVDHFKRINDTHGHAVGDRVLQQFADVLQGQVRSGDYVARWGGEEFVLVFRPMPLAFLPILGERLRAAVASYPFDIGGGATLRLSCSIGLCQYPLLGGEDNDAELHWEHLLELADRALYRVKREGRNGWGAYQALPGTRASTVLALLREGEQALEQSPALRYLHGGPAEAARAVLEADPRD